MNNPDVVCHEYGTLFGDADLIDAIIESNCLVPLDEVKTRQAARADWDLLTNEEQRDWQQAWVSPMPSFAERGN